jgi:hypothetical protein
MNKSIWLASAALIAALETWGCGSGGSASGSGYVPKKPRELESAILPPGQEQDYFPFSVGSQWTFESVTSQATVGQAASTNVQEITYKLAKVAPGPDGSTEATFDISENGAVLEREVWRVSKSGLYQVALGKTLHPLTPPEIVLPFPVKVEGTFDWKGSAQTDTGETITGVNHGVVTSEEPVDTDMGTYKALLITSTGKRSTSKGDSTVTTKLWLIPKVGIGRFRQEVEGEFITKDPKAKGKPIHYQLVNVRKLKSYTAKK